MARGLVEVEREYALNCVKAGRSGAAGSTGEVQFDPLCCKMFSLPVFAVGLVYLNELRRQRLFPACFDDCGHNLTVKTNVASCNKTTSELHYYFSKIANDAPNQRFWFPSLPRIPSNDKTRHQ
jgi:hypothetical protein